jgi:hypothetical protein
MSCHSGDPPQAESLESTLIISRQILDDLPAGQAGPE